MKTYLVGGAVRDKLLNYPVKDRDWVIVGAKPHDLLNQGYQQVGADFPVFLHPETKEEYALARTERKSGQGYTGFICDFNENITLEQDLERRDLTINAIAMDENNKLIDPFNGISDINNRVLRHISSAFAEDPLRVLRVARFAARLNHLGFTIAPETLELMIHIVKSGEIDHLTAERVWKETLSALATKDPHIFFEVLRQCNALSKLYPEIDKLFGIPQPIKWHPEIDSGIHTLLALKQASILTSDLTIRFAVLCHDVGKTMTPHEQWPHHKNHCENGIPLIHNLSSRLKIPNIYKKTACFICRYHETVHHAPEISSGELIKLFDGIDAWRNPDHLEKLILSSTADFKGRKEFEHRPYPQADFLKQAYDIAKTVPIKDIIESGFKGELIREELTKRRINILNEWKK